jgi:hypothetical protein
MRLFWSGILLAGLISSIFCSRGDNQNTLKEGIPQSIKTMKSKDEAKRPDISFRGYILYSPLLSTTTYLIDQNKNVVHTWESEFPPGVSVYLLDNGNLLRSARHPDAPLFLAAGQGGRIQEYTWEGELIWDFVLASQDRIQHHDIEPLPNGNVLAIAWERKTRQQAIQTGRRIELLTGDEVWPDCILEIQPHPPNGGRIVWEWHIWDHLIQDYAIDRENYGNVSDHPELIDVNGDQKPLGFSDKIIKRLRALGYIHQNASSKNLSADLFHTNSINYNHRLDQIVLSVLTFNEIWVIDHGTTTREAAGHSGGQIGKGGDLLYRWGNPRNYGRGMAEHQQLYGQHDARWIPESCPGAGNILIFNNGDSRPEGRYSSVIEIQSPLDASGDYSIKNRSSFGPTKPVWEYTAPNKRSFFADFLSGAQRLTNGNTLICSGPEGYFFEVTPNGDIIWEYKNLFSGDAPNPAGDPPYSVFRATPIPKNHPALKGRELKPLNHRF